MADKPNYSFCVRFSGGMKVLVPEMGIDEAALDGLVPGDRVHVIIKAWRNVDRLRAWWLLLKDCIEACDLDWPLEAFSEYVRLEIKFVDLHKLPDGNFWSKPKSIAFTSKLTEAEFVEFFRLTERFLAERFGFSKGSE